MACGDPRCPDCGRTLCVGLFGKRCPSKDYPEYLEFTWNIPYSVNINGDSFASGCFDGSDCSTFQIPQELDLFEKMYQDAYRKQPPKTIP